MNVNAFADNITLHTKNLTIATDKIKLYEMQVNSTIETLEADEKEMTESEKKIRKFQFVPKHDYLIIYPVNILSKFRKYIVKIPFEGALDTSLLGYYRSSYYDKKANRKMWVASSQNQRVPWPHRIFVLSPQLACGHTIWTNTRSPSFPLLW